MLCGAYSRARCLFCDKFPFFVHRTPYFVGWNNWMRMQPAKKPHKRKMSMPSWDRQCQSFVMSLPETTRLQVLEIFRDSFGRRIEESNLPVCHTGTHRMYSVNTCMFGSISVLSNGCEKEGLFVILKVKPSLKLISSATSPLQSRARALSRARIVMYKILSFAP